MATTQSASKSFGANFCRPRLPVDRAVISALGGFAVLIVTSIVVAPVDAFAAPAGSAECRSAKPAASREYWSWRQIDGRQCWYVGRPGRDKATLHWPQPQREMRRETIGVGTHRGIEPAAKEQPAIRQQPAIKQQPAVIEPPVITPAMKEPLIHDPIIRPKPVTTIAIRPALIDQPAQPAAAASFEERFASERWSSDRERGDRSARTTGRQ